MLRSRNDRLPRLKGKDKNWWARWVRIAIYVLFGLALFATLILLYWNRRPPAEDGPLSPGTDTPAADRPAATRPTVVTETPLPTVEPSLTPTERASNTPPATVEAVATLAPEPTVLAVPFVSPTPPADDGYPYAIEGPYYRANLVANYAGCDWLGLAGEVFGRNGEPQGGLIVHVWGGGIDHLAYSGEAQAYGPSGWERSLDDHPKEGLFYVQLHDGVGPVSAVLEVQTVDDCYQNLIIINFRQR
jgi:hypothetical protein